MKPDPRNLLQQLSVAPLQTKLAAGVCTLAIVAALSIGGWVAAQPHFVKLYANLGDAERVAVEKALAEAQLSFRVSDFPGPFVVYVDESRFDDAQIAVALAGALAQAPRGIDAGQAGTAAIFMSSSERAQSMQKREWQECEHLLEQLDFVAGATVTTSMPESSPLKPKKPVMVSVALELRSDSALSSERAENVATLVRFRFGVPAENVVISDQSGNLLYDPATSDVEDVRVRDLFEHAARYDRELAAKANSLIDASFGPRKARVTVTSQWNHDQSTIVDEKIDPDPVLLSREKQKTSTPQGTPAEVGGPAGVASNVANEFGNGNAALGEAAPKKSAAVATTEDEKLTYDASRSRTQTVRSAPTLERLSVSLVLDESLAAKQAEIRALVEAAVGFDVQRNDALGMSTTSFAVDAPRPLANDSGAPSSASGTDSAPAAPTRWWIERGIEIAAGLGFVILLVWSLRPSRAAKLSTATAVDDELAAGPAEIDPEQLARAHIEELIKSDPRRVGEILSRWADEATPTGAAR